jgi:hypothetical protein
MPKNWPDAQAARVTGQDWFSGWTLTARYDEAQTGDRRLAVIDLFEAQQPSWAHDLSGFDHVFFFWVDPLLEPPQHIADRVVAQTGARAWSMIFDGQSQHLGDLPDWVYTKSLTWFIGTELFNPQTPVIEWQRPRHHRFDCLLGHMTYNGGDRSIRRNKCYILAQMLDHDLANQSLINASTNHALDLEWFDNQGRSRIRHLLRGFERYRSMRLADLDDNELLESIGTNAQDADLQYQYVWRDINGEMAHTLFCSILPTAVYDQTWFTVVAETNDYAVNQLTEKTARPLLAGRPFVLFGAPNSLAYLRQFGFETFHDVIDESYDQEPDVLCRFDLAWQQLERLATNPRPDLIYEKLLPVLQHNQEVMRALRPRLLADLGAWIQQRIS